MWAIQMAVVALCCTVSLSLPYIENSSERNKRCTKPECDTVGALSYCSGNGNLCNAGHEEVKGTCTSPIARCCRSTCHGPESHCIANGSTCDAGFIPKPGKCKVEGFFCCGRP